MSTLSRLQAHLAAPEIKPLEQGREYKSLAPHVKCADGSTMSVQASEYHYCNPRDNYGPYLHVEVWNCGIVDAWAEFVGDEDPYAFVPIALVAAEIDRHGGFAN